MDITELLVQWGNGDRAAFDRLIPLVYEELKKVARRAVRQERRAQTLQATALVNEVYLRLIDYRRVRPRDRAHFLSIAAQAVRRILIDRARGRTTAKRGAGAAAISLDEAPDLAVERASELVALDEALTRLACVDARKARVVELRYFGGLTGDETAEALDVSTATVERDWTTARLWLRREMGRAQ